MDFVAAIFASRRLFAFGYVLSVRLVDIYVGLDLFCIHLRFSTSFLFFLQIANFFCPFVLFV